MDLLALMAGMLVGAFLNDILKWFWRWVSLLSIERNVKVRIAADDPSNKATRVTITTVECLRPNGVRAKLLAKGVLKRGQPEMDRQRRVNKLYGR